MIPHDDFAEMFASGGFTGKDPKAGFVFPHDYSHPPPKSDTFRIPKADGYVGVDRARGPDHTGITVSKGGFTQFVINISHKEYPVPRTGDVMLMIADIDRVERTAASRYADQEAKLRRDIAKAMSKTLDKNFFRAMRGGYGNRA